MVRMKTTSFDFDALYHQVEAFAVQEIRPFNWELLQSCLTFWISSRRENNNYTDVLPLLICQAAGGEIQTAVPLAGFWTLSLLAGRIFDDLQDNEGQQNPWNNHGKQNALPVGTAFLSAANCCLSKLKVEFVALQKLIRVLGTTTAFAAKSQYMPTNHLSLELYLQRIIGTTGLPYKTIAWASGVAGGVSVETLSHLETFGYNFGIWQAIKSDCQDLRLRQGAVGDLSSGVYSLPIIYAAALKTHPYHTHLVNLLAQTPLNETQIDEAITILEDMGAVLWSMQMAQVYYNQAVEALNTIPLERAEGLIAYVSGKD